MAEKRLTNADVVERLAAESGLTVEQVKALFRAQADLAYSGITDRFPIPGIGVLATTERPERKMVMRFGPKAGQEIVIPAKRKLEFRVSPLAKAMIFGVQKTMPDIFKSMKLPEFEFSIEATRLSDPSPFIADMGSPFTLAHDGKPLSVDVVRLEDLQLPTGKISAADGLIGRGTPFSRSVLPGSYPFALVIARLGTDERVALAIIRLSEKRVHKWAIAAPEGQDTSGLEPNEVFGYGVDSGTGSFCDASVQALVAEANEADIGFSDQIIEEMGTVYKNTRNWVHIATPNGSLVVFSSGYGDGFYASYFGLDEAGNPAALVTDFKLLNWGPLARK